MFCTARQIAFNTFSPSSPSFPTVLTERKLICVVNCAQNPVPKKSRSKKNQSGNDKKNKKNNSNNNNHSPESKCTTAPKNAKSKCRYTSKQGKDAYAFSVSGPNSKPRYIFQDLGKLDDDELIIGDEYSALKNYHDLETTPTMKGSSSSLYWSIRKKIDEEKIELIGEAIDPNIQRAKTSEYVRTKIADAVPRTWKDILKDVEDTAFLTLQAHNRIAMEVNPPIHVFEKSCNSDPAEPYPKFPPALSSTYSTAFSSVNFQSSLLDSASRNLGSKELNELCWTLCRVMNSFVLRKTGHIRVFFGSDEEVQSFREWLTASKVRDEGEIKVKISVLGADKKNEEDTGFILMTPSNEVYEGRLEDVQHVHYDSWSVSRPVILVNQKLHAITSVSNGTFKPMFLQDYSHAFVFAPVFIPSLDVHIFLLRKYPDDWKVHVYEFNNGENTFHHIGTSAHRPNPKSILEMLRKCLL